jgi:hypothetical protein
MKSRLWFLLAAIGAIGCGGYSADEEVTLGSAVYTQPAPNVNFTAFKTYYLDPQMEVWEDGVQKLSQPVPASTVTTINTQMQKYGYTAIPGSGVTPQPPNLLPASDVGLRTVFLQSTFTYYVSSGYCSVYWAYYACWPGWAYSGSYSTGTVLMMMVDTRPGTGTPAPDSAPVWASALYAVLRGSSLENSNQLNSAIVRAYDQSPYLKNSP